MNITILSLYLRGLYNSPFISSSNALQHSQFKISSSQLSNFMKPFFYSSIPQKLNVEKSLFSSFLDSAIHIDSMMVDSTKISNEHISVFDKILCCYNSEFINCKCTFGEGGAIYCITKIILRHCYFDKCHSTTGGAVYCLSDADIESCTFIYCLSVNYGGGIYSKNSNRFSMLYTTIFMCSVIGIEPHGKGGCMALHTNDDVSILYNNISGSVALNKDGCADIATGNINIRYTVVDQCFSNNGCGGLHFTDCFFTIKFSVFVLLASQMKVNDIGVSLHADNPQKNCSISYCSIFRRENTNFYTIHMDNSANRISISNCCFTGGKNQEINESRVIEKDNIFWATSCMTYVMFYLPKEMGYKNNKEIQKVQKKNTIDELFGSQAERFLSTLAVPLTIVGCVLGVILYVAFGFLGLFPMPSRRRNRPTTTRRNRNSTQI